MSHLTELTAIVAPPEMPMESTGDWKSVEQQLGITLPADYKEYIETYGTGRILDLGFDADRGLGTLCDITVLNPFSERRVFNLVHKVRKYQKSYDAGYKLHPKSYLYPPWPASPGLFCWGTSGNGDVFFWLFQQGTFDLRIAAMHDGSAQMYTFINTGMVSFLVELLSNTLRHSPFERFAKPSFEPLQDSE